MEIRFTISRSFIRWCVAVMFFILLLICFRLAVKNGELTRTVYEQQERIMELEGDTAITRQYKPSMCIARHALHRMN